MGELAALEQDAPAAGAALQPDIRPQPHYLPLVAPTGMGLAQPQDVVQVEIR